MNDLKIVLAVLLLSGCAARTANPPPSQSPMDECRQAQQSGDSIASAEKCGAIMRDQ
ncbi:hypothetical protein [Citrobacter amalonaticus]|uniref:hypothetical protein n=1 Tax=Citrobacter amalonaticus TaxID=35703 RepID=UPI0015E1AA78|nr:hypothetical protein [Citrobacter amalonaticus]